VQDGRRVVIITFPAPAFSTTTVLLYMAPVADVEVDAVMLGGYLDSNDITTTSKTSRPQDVTPPVIYLYGSADVTVDLHSTYLDAGKRLTRLQRCLCTYNVHTSSRSTETSLSITGILDYCFEAWLQG
jgi:hypothetical protein